MAQPSQRPTVAELLAAPPALHMVEGTLSPRWKLQDDDLSYLDQVLRPGMRTLETGAGLSTVVFALKGARHICVAPDQGLIDRIRAFCRESGISDSDVRFFAAPSEEVLPGLSETDLDFALIDGRHGFPAPFIDAYYISRMLKVGGSLMIDDLHIWTTELLARYLATENSWKPVRETWHAATFEKRDQGVLAGEWTNQDFVVRRSLRRSFTAKLRLAGRMVRTGDFTPVRRILGL